MGSEETTSSEGTPAAGAEAGQSAQPPMNRAEKRALAHNKKAAAGGAKPAFGKSNTPGTGRSPGRAGNVGLPRTGHK